MSNWNFDVTLCDYTPFYCEENVYFLCKKLSIHGGVDMEDLFIVFISNENKKVPLWHQKASLREDGIVLWDYHVICIKLRGEGNSCSIVWDLDSNLPLPSIFAHYFSDTIRPLLQMFTEFQRFFRIVHAPFFSRFFASDRRHMKDSVGNWIASPPVYEPIVAEDGCVHNLNEYIEMHDLEAVESSGAVLKNAVISQKLGAVVSETQFVEFFS